MEALKPGTRAPEFTLPSTPDQKVSLSEFLGKRVVLVFYPADWSPVCGDQLALYNELLKESADRKYHFTLLSDFEPKGATAKAYGVYREKEGVAERALFVLDTKGVIRWSYVSPVGVNPGADGILKALERIPKGE